MSTKIRSLITEEAYRFQSFYGRKPDHVFLGVKEVAEIDAMVRELQAMGMLVAGRPVPRPQIDGMEIFYLSVETHLSFGLEQPSPCG